MLTYIRGKGWVEETIRYFGTVGPNKEWVVVRTIDCPEGVKRSGSRWNPLDFIDRLDYLDLAEYIGPYDHDGLLADPNWYCLINKKDLP